jgi:hypothetical protein
MSKNQHTLYGKSYDVIYKCINKISANFLDNPMKHKPSKNDLFDSTNTAKNEPMLKKS